MQIPLYLTAFGIPACEELCDYPFGTLVFSHAIVFVLTLSCLDSQTLGGHACSQAVLANVSHLHHEPVVVVHICCLWQMVPLPPDPADVIVNSQTVVSLVSM